MFNSQYVPTREQVNAIAAVVAGHILTEADVQALRTAAAGLNVVVSNNETQELAAKLFPLPTCDFDPADGITLAVAECLDAVVVLGLAFADSQVVPVVDSSVIEAAVFAVEEVIDRASAPLTKAPDVPEIDVTLLDAVFHDAMATVEAQHAESGEAFDLGEVAAEVFALRDQLNVILGIVR